MQNVIRKNNTLVKVSQMVGCLLSLNVVRLTSSFLGGHYGTLEEEQLVPSCWGLQILIVVSNTEEEVEAPPSSEEFYYAPPLAECIGPVYTGQQAIHSSPRYREAREQRRREKLKAERMEPVKGTCAAGKRVPKQVTMRERVAKEASEWLSSKEEHLAVMLGAYELDSEKEN